MKFVCFIIVMAVCVEHASARLLRGQSSSSKPGGVNQVQGRRGATFDFSVDGGAENFLSGMDPAKLNRVLSNSKFRQQRNKLAKMLDEDKDMVSLVILLSYVWFEVQLQQRQVSLQVLRPQTAVLY